MKIFTLKDIKTFLPANYIQYGNEEACFDNAKTTLEANNTSLVFIASNRQDQLELLNQTKAAVVICDEKLAQQNESEKLQLLIGVKNPKEVFARIVNDLFVKRTSPQIHHSTIIHPEAKIDTDVYIGPLCVIGKCTIGSGAKIFGSVHIYDDVEIGKNVIINAGTVIGADGFGYIKDEKGIFNFPHIGNVVIEDNVEIGANTCIDKGALGSTLIKTGTKIDNLVHISHNVTIGKNCMIIANSLIGGSTKIGDDSWIAPSSTLRDAIEVGSNVVVGMGAVVTKSIGENQIQAGNPSRSIEQFVKLNNLLKELINRKE